ncbi:MAG: peptide-methionine (R)-S-oxide reductase MsrB [Saprospiraceae bacterium]|nr:peptide-methionine (R)-S-oxide reductase MsrB [Saprospiraceae bacterium]
MNRTAIFLISILFATIAGACQAQDRHASDEAAFFVNERGDTIQRIFKSPDEWASELDEFAYYVLREQGTERAFSGALWDNKEKGTYLCAACGLALFASETKFRSGTGWPSFYAPLDATHVDRERDVSHGMIRTEVHCNRCGGHLGHVFNDGPQPTGLRYCINSVSLKFEPGS